MKEKFDVKGMTCSACSLAVEREVSKVSGVKSVNVNLLTNSMDIDKEESLDNSAIISAVEKAGYEAEVRGESQEKKKNFADTFDEQIRSLKNRLMVSIPLMVLLMYIAMGHMLGLPYPNYLTTYEGAGVLILIQFLISLPVLYVNRSYFINGFKALFSGNPNMDTLVGMGSAAGVVYGLFAMIMINYGLGQGDRQLVEKYMHDIYFESATMILTLITLGKFLEARSKKKTTESINKLVEIQPDQVTIIRDGREYVIDLEDVSRGDLIKILPGERIAVDGIIKSGSSALDQQAITGESIPVEVTEGDKVLSGSLNKTGSFVMEAVNVGDDTTLSKIIALMEEASASKAPISRLADKVSSIFVPAVMSLSVLAFIIWMYLGYGFEFSFSIAIGVLVISCPCALGLATPVAMMVSIGKAADNGIIVKSSEALEELHKADVMVFDKTGTISKGLPIITDIISVNNFNKDKMIQIAASIESMSQQPLAEAIIRDASMKNIDLLEVKNFNSFTGKGIKGDIGGKTYYIGNDKLMKDVGVFDGQIEERAKLYSKQGKTSVYLADSKNIFGILAIADSIKPSSVDAIRQINDMGIKTVMLTGDNELTAKAMADKVGVSEFKAGLLPQDKDSIISSYMEEGNKVVMVGDGINDAPALMRADIGIAIAEGTDVAVESADLVLMKSDLSDIVNSLRLSHKTIKTIKGNLFWAFIYNILAIPIAMGILYIPYGIKLSPMIGAFAMSMSSVFVVTNSLRIKNFEPIEAHLSQEEKTMNDQKYDNIEIDRENEDQTTNKENTIEEEKNMKKTLYVEGMSCNHCKMRVEKTLSQIDGAKVNVSLEDGRVDLETPEEVEDEKLREMIDEAGYKLSKIEK